MKLLFSVLFLTAQLVCAEQSVDLEAEYIKIQKEAKAIAGEPNDIPQRAVALFKLYQDSKGNHTFPLIALHGALWAMRFFDEKGPIAERLIEAFSGNEQEAALGLQKLKEFETDLKEANRYVFIEVYTTYYFAKKYADHPDAKKYLGRELLEKLKWLHQFNEWDMPLTDTEKRELFEKTLEWEQLHLNVHVPYAFSKIDCPVLRNLISKPFVHFEYFRLPTYFFFNNFNSTPERIQKAMAAYDEAVKVGWKKVIETIGNYGVDIPKKGDGCPGYLSTS